MVNEQQAEIICPKCGSNMVEGSIKIPIERMGGFMTTQPLTTGFSMGGMHGSPESYTTSLTWDEKTGEKTGFILKRDQVLQLRVHGYRCSYCNYIELYV